MGTRGALPPWGPEGRPLARAQQRSALSTRSGRWLVVTVNSVDLGWDQSVNSFCCPLRDKPKQTSSPGGPPASPQTRAPCVGAWPPAVPGPENSPPHQRALSTVSPPAPGWACPGDSRAEFGQTRASAVRCHRGHHGQESPVWEQATDKGGCHGNSGCHEAPGRCPCRLGAEGDPLGSNSPRFGGGCLPRPTPDGLPFSFP